MSSLQAAFKRFSTLIRATIIPFSACDCENLLIEFTEFFNIQSIVFAFMFTDVNNNDILSVRKTFLCDKKESARLPRFYIPKIV